MTIIRVSMFKIPKEEDIDFLLSRYKTLRSEARKDSAPYILSIEAGRALPDQRSQGYTLVAKTMFHMVKPDTSPQAIYGYTSLMALGIGFFNQAGYSVLQAKVKPEEIPWALGFMTGFQ
ncbi:hypothetical protein INS49_006302 [Diaporthe citri]|uniref:uncharacterized protein n=1 Tax=Diaporthe citri TaxID=83186 RepID=UPI001C7F99AA|nr:uncharacterized protein INS49_006302 [Diaporthe citri]KAG6364698.1 hypothetical protein INS49_006302 [Diaporthe citri]